MAIDFAFLDRGIIQIKNVRIRSDNVTRHVSRIVKLFLSSCNIAHERIHPATPKEDAHIESFNSILEKEVIRRFEFSSFEDPANTISSLLQSTTMKDYTLRSITGHQGRYMKNGKKT